MNKPTAWTGAILAIGFVAAVMVNWPGHLSYDPIVQLLQGRMGIYNTWHPPVMAWLLGLFDAVLPGTGLFVAFDAVLAFGALLALLGLGRARWASAATALLIVLLPQLWLYQGEVWKDVLFADSAVAGFVALAWTAQHWDRPWARGAWLAASIGLLSLAALTRQNGAVALPFAAAALLWIARRRSRTVRGALSWGGGFLIATLVLTGAASALLNLRSDGASGPAEQFAVLQVYDLSGAAAREPGYDMAALHDRVLEAAIRGPGAKLYTPVRNDPILSAPQVQAALEQADAGALTPAWRELILAHPGLYLRLRAAAFGWVLLTPGSAACRPVFVGVEGPADTLRALGMAPRHDARDLALDRAAKTLTDTPVFSHAAFGLLALACLIVLLRRRMAADIAMAGMLLSAFAFAATFFVISIACDYRYLYLLDLCAPAALLYLSLDRRSAA